MSMYIFQADHACAAFPKLQSHVYGSTRYRSGFLRCDCGCFQDVAATLATEEAEDVDQVTKLRSALESVEHKRRKVSCQQP